MPNVVVSSSVDAFMRTANTLAMRNSIGADMPSTGVLSGGELTRVSGTVLGIAAGSGYIADNTVSPPAFSYVTWGSSTVDLTARIATDTATDVAIDVNGDVVLSTRYTRSQLRELILLGGADHRENVEIRNAFTIQVPSYGAGLSVRDLARAVGDINQNGNDFSPAGTNLQIKKSAGAAFSFGRNAITDPSDPHVISLDALDPATFAYVYRNGSGGTAFGIERDTINPGIYDDGSGTPASVPTNDFTYQRFLVFPNTNSVFIQLGTDIWNTLREARANIGFAEFPTLPGLASALIRGILIIRQGTTNLANDANAVFVRVDRFGGGAGGSDLPPDPIAVPFEIVTEAGISRTLVLTDAQKYIRCTNGSAVSVEIPLQTSVTWAANTEIVIEQAGAGKVTVTGVSGVTVQTSVSAATRAQYAAITLKRVAENEWVCGGERE